MRIILTVVFLMPFIVLAQDKEEIQISAGGTYSVINDFDNIDFAKHLGYYGSISITKGLNKFTSFSGGLIYMNQHIEILKTKFDINSVNANFSYNIHPYKGFKIPLGFQIGIITNKEEGMDIGLFTATAGLGYGFDRIEIMGKYGHAINDNSFDSFLSLGLGYKF